MAKQTTEKLKIESSQVVDLLDFIYNNNKKIQALGYKPKALNIKGVHGIGKSTVVIDYCEENNIQHVLVDFSSLEETGDVIGLPKEEYYMCIDNPVKKEVTLPNGKTVMVNELNEQCVWVVKSAIQTYQSKGYHLTGETRMSYSIPKWLQEIDRSKGGILILDDFNRAPQAFMQMVMGIFLDQRTQAWKLPLGWTVVATSNPGDSNYNSEEMDPAQADRYFEVEMKFSLKEWAVYASKKKYNEDHIAFMLDAGGEFIGNNLSARAVSSFFELVREADYATNKGIISSLCESRCGVPFKSAFVTAMENKKYQLPNAEFMINEPTKDKVKDAIIKCIGKELSYRPDIAWVLCQRILLYCKDCKGTQQELDGIKYLITSNIFNENQAFQTIKKVALRNKALSPLLLDDEVLNIIGA